MASDFSFLMPKLKVDVLTMLHKACRGYLGASLSSLDILACLYFAKINGKNVFTYNPEKPGCSERDYFILSQWYSCPSLYACLAEAGFFEKSHLDYYGKYRSFLPSYPWKKIPGVEATVTELGHGLSIANGIALSLKLDKKSNRVYVLMGSSELQIGQVWEAVMASWHYQLHNVLVFLDHNRLQESGEIRGILNIEPIADKFEAFGWKVFRVGNGHDLDQILDVLVRAWKIERHPSVIICDTISGHGIPFASNKAIYYKSVLSDEEFKAVTSSS